MKKLLKKITAFALALAIVSAPIYSPEKYPEINNVSAANTTDGSELRYVDGEITFLYTVTNGEAEIRKGMSTDRSLPYWMIDIFDSVEIPDTIDGYPVTSIADYAFYELKYDNISLPDSIKKIGDNALGIYSPDDPDTVFSFPESTEEIGAYPFKNFYGKKIIIPEKVSKLSTEAMALPENDAYVDMETDKVYYEIAEGNPYFYQENGAILSADDSVLYYYFTETHKEKYVVPEKTKEICARAFACADTDEIVLPDSIEKIGNRAFIHSTVQKINIPDKIKNIPRRAFKGCSKLSDISLPDGIISIDTEAFANCRSLGKISLGSSLEKIDPSAFTNAKAASFEVSSGCKYYSSEDGVLFDKKKETLLLFAKNSLISSYEIPDTVKTISSNSFSEADSLKKISIPESVTTIEDSAFQGCTSLASCSLPSGLKTIQIKTFENCSSLSEISIGNQTENIEDYAFKGTAISSIEIPKSVKYLPTNVFSECRKLKNIYVSSGTFGLSKYNAPNGAAVSLTDIDEVTVVDGVIFSKDMKTLINFSTLNSDYPPISYYTSYKKYEIPSGVTEIAENAFSDSSVYGVVLPDTLLKIDDHAFYNCTMLETVDFNNTSPEIGKGVFYGCSSLYSFQLPENISVIPEDTFSECTNIYSAALPDSTVKLLRGSMPCTISQIYIPASVTYIDEEAFNTSTLGLICAPEGSYAEKFANEHNIEFVSDTDNDLNGDVNGDGNTNIVDLITLKSVLLNQNDSIKASPDITKDGKVTVLDAVKLTDILHGKPILKGFKDIKTCIEPVLNEEFEYSRKYWGTFITTQDEINNLFADCFKDSKEAAQYAEKYGKYLDDYVLYINIECSHSFTFKADIYSLNNRMLYAATVPGSSCSESFIISVMVPRSLYNNQNVSFCYDDTRNRAAKPVIYLYPEEKTDINVQVMLDDTSEFTYTYPEYPEKTGWTVTAEPDSTLKDASGKEYPYLFWEADTPMKFDMSEGFVVRGDETKEFLTEKLQYLGLSQKEYDDFLEYWLPKMQDNNYNLIKFQTEDYEKMAKLVITPEPESVQRVFMTFKALDEWIYVPEQELTPFERHGYTVIEWGGSELMNTKIF